MRPAIRVTVGVVTLAVALPLASCTRGGASSLVVYSVPGRGLQPAWWDGLPIDIASAELTLPADALFEAGSATVRPEIVAELEAFGRRLAPYLRGTPGTWTIVGATDGLGSTEDNYLLGLRRAEAVMGIVSTVPGVDESRLLAHSWGETHPAVDESSAPDLAEARARNRRVLFLRPG